MALILAATLLGYTSAYFLSVMECDIDEPDRDLALPGGYQSISNYEDWDDLCSLTSGVRPNAGCLCLPASGTLQCTEPENPLRGACFNNCHCVWEEHEDPPSSDDESGSYDSATDSDESAVSEDISGKCYSRCTSVSRGCPVGDGSCSCTAPAISLYFWLDGVCASTAAAAAAVVASRTGAKPNIGGRSLHNSTHASNVTSTISPWYNNATIEAMSKGQFPAPCNSSYVSLACANSTDGIVYEGPEMWLGALLPPNATELPPIPPRWLKINGFPANHSDHNRWL